MKIIIIVLILLLPPCISEAQPEFKKRLAAIAKEKLEGVWVSVSGTDSVVLYLLQAPYTPVDRLTITDSIVHLFGWHEIYKQGKLVESSAGFLSDTFTGNMTIGMVYEPGEKQPGFISLRDLTHNHDLTGNVVYLWPDRMHVTTYEKPVCIRTEPYYPGQAFPKEMLFSRISKTPGYNYYVKVQPQ